MIKVTFGRIAMDPAINNGRPSLMKPFTDNAAPVQQTMIAVDDILDLRDAGYSNWHIESMIPTIDKKDISACVGFAATHLRDRPEYHRNNRYKSARILFDENLSPGLVGALYDRLGGLSHIYYEGMSGYTDEFIYYRPQSQLKPATDVARRKIRNVIITQDSDLCDIAEKQWKRRMLSCATPESIDFSDTNVIIHVENMELAKAENAHHLGQLARDIMKCVFNPAFPSPWFRVTKTKVEPGSSLQKLASSIEESQRVNRWRTGNVSEEERAELRAIREARRSPRNTTPVLQAA